ncbi:hypothetical protein AWC38_SpisGene5314 [Stylophora pistillata]|uniref:Uncharacterized protein n=1 Tax=Stylophora pistillata TaxID=50429 RepID=A0A2B4SKF6_STYPI|nr:hypothetical protein AWC38_SpisGene5314 [Stylophora pistillata]
MLEEVLRKFAQENFSHKYYPVLHGESEKIQPLALAVKRPRLIWKRPRGRHEIKVFAELAKYVQGDEEAQVLRDALESHVKEEMFQFKPTIDIGNSRAEEYSLTVLGYPGATIRFSGDQEVLKLGRLSQKYIDDPDLRGILANTPLDYNKIKGIQGDELLLITSVISSEQFQLEGERKQETEAEFSGKVPPKVSPFFKHFFQPEKWHARYRSSCSPPEVASRNSTAPILFKCCRVIYLKEENRLEIWKGEFVGKTVTIDVFGGNPGEKDPDYDSTYVEICPDETDHPDALSAEDYEKLDPILFKVLLPTKNREQRLSDEKWERIEKDGANLSP